MQPNAADRLVAHVIATADAVPLESRAQLYRDTADLIAREEDVAMLRALAADCDAAADKVGQLLLNFKRRAQG